MYFIATLTCLVLTNSIQAQTNETGFKVMFKTFHSAIKTNKTKQLEKLIYFPLPTDVSSQDVENGKPIESITKGKFKQYASDIFNQKVIEILKKSKYNDITEVTSLSGTYYAALQKRTDKSSKMYELYIQYQEDQTHAESYFTFVFGQVLGKYKIIAYYAKWPVK
jgi:hypothetical protein